MQPRGRALEHAAAPLLYQYAREGCPINVGRNWTADEIEAAVKRGPHPSSHGQDAIQEIQKEAREKAAQGFVRIVKWDDIKKDLDKYPKLKISPLAMIPHKSRKFRAILDLSFRLKVFGIEIPSVNEATEKLAPQHAMAFMGTTLKRIIEAIATSSTDEGDILFSKIDIKDGFWRLSVSEEDAWNFAYVLPAPPNQPIELVIPTALQMGWTESPPFFCAATETVRDLAEKAMYNTTESLPPHPLEHHILPPDKWPDDKMDKYATSFRRLIEVYVDDFIALVQTSDRHQLLHITRALLHAIHDVFPPPHISGHKGDDPISLKKLLDGDGLWDTRKELLGWVFDGTTRCIHLPHDKMESIQRELKNVCRLQRVPLKRFESLIGKLRHAAIGLPSANGLCQPFNRALANRPNIINLGRKGSVYQALKDWRSLLQQSTKRPTHVNELVPKKLADVGYVDASGHGAGGCWFSCTDQYNPTVWRVHWPPSITNDIVSTTNPKGSISNSDLEMAGILLAWLVREELGSLHHHTVALFCDNTPAVAWATKLASKRSTIAGRLIRALAVRQRACHAAPLLTTHIAGDDNLLGDIPSRSFNSTCKWNCPTNKSFLTRFNNTFPLPQQQCWQFYQLPQQIFIRVISEMQTKPLPLDGWLRLPKTAKHSGADGLITPSLSTLTPSSSTHHSNKRSELSPVLLQGSGEETTAKKIESLVDASRMRFAPLARPANWTTASTLCKKHPKNI